MSNLLLTRQAFRIIFVLLFLGIGPFCFGQELPNTQVFIFQSKIDALNKMSLEDPRWVTSFNEQGYNNQPEFIDGWWYISVRLAGQDQNEIIALDIPNRKLMRMTDTPESEYSPSNVPGGNSKDFSVVRVEKDSSQYVWIYDIEGKPRQNKIIQKENMVGYQNWLNQDKIALNLVHDPVSLVIADKKTEETDFITSGVGRCLKNDTEGNLYFTQRVTKNAPWQIKKLPVGSFRSSLVAVAPGKNEDFAVLKDGSIIMGLKNELYRFVPGQSSSWEFVADFSKYGATSISRISINDYNELAVVCIFN